MMLRNELRFNINDLAELYDITQRRGTDLILAGDQGVYLCTVATPRDVFYAENCNPDTMEFDEWWKVKNDTFGGNDGAISIPANELKSWVDDMEKFRNGRDGHFYWAMIFTQNKIEFSMVRIKEDK